MEVSNLIQLLSPIIVWIVTRLITLFKSEIAGWVIVGVIVPILSIIITLISGLNVSEWAFWQQVLWGCLAVFLNELKRQLEQK